MLVTEIDGRLARIRMPVRVLARQAGLDHHTLHRMIAGKTSPIMRSFDRALQALVAEERALLLYLLALHPDLAGLSSPPGGLTGPAADPVSRERGGADLPEVAA